MALLRTAIEHHQAGRLAEAAASYRQVLSAQPGSAEVWFNLGVVLKQQGKLEEAVDAYRRVIVARPDYVDAHYNLGNALMLLRRFGEAVEAYRRTVALNPGSANAQYNLGLALQQQARAGEAVVAFRQAVALKPDHAEAYFNLGNALTDEGALDEAIAALRQAAAIQQNFAEAHFNIGNVLKRQGKLDAAVAAYREATTLKPDWAEAYSNIGNALSDQGRVEEAVSAYRKAIGLKPDNAELHYNLGNGLKLQNKLEEAVTAYRYALALAPNHADAHLNLGIALTGQGRHDEAYREYREVIRLRPDWPEAHSNLLLCLHYSEATTAQQLSDAHRQWGERFERQIARRQTYANDRTPDRQLRIGYVSPDFRAHSVAYFIEPLLQKHDRQAVEVFCYAEVMSPDAVTERLRALSDHWLATVGLSDEELAGRIEADRIDILVDLAGHTAYNRLGVFARAPAPVQATWLGYPNTTGLSAINYRLVDAVTDPAGSADALSIEAPVRLPGGFLCFGGVKDAPSPAAPPCGANGFITFGSFNNPAKLSLATLDMWVAVLARLPQARLLLKGKSFADAATRALLLERFAERGVAGERIELEGWRVSRSDHLAHYDRVDIALDSFPYNGTTTTCEALWMGVPVVTLKGDRHSSRVGASLLAQLGMSEWVAASADDYVRIATKLAGEPDRLAELRRSLRARMAASPLCDGAAFARKIEAALGEMWRRWCAGAG